ncbi:hypothetical protein ScPMuIL_003375 [Solemya velum]
MAKAVAKLGGMATKLGSKGPAMVQGIVQNSKPKLATFWKYAKVELKPPSPSEIPQIQQSLQNLVLAARTGKWKQLSVREAWLNTLIGMEIAFCFFIGEIIGKGSVVGYSIPGAVDYEAHV